MQILLVMPKCRPTITSMFNVTLDLRSGANKLNDPAFIPKAP